MFHGERSSDFSNFLIRLLSCNQVVYGEYYRSQISQPFSPDLHRRPEACIQSCRDPRRSKVGSAVQVRQGFRALEPEYFGKVSAYV